MEQHEPYLLTSLIRKLTELLHEHGDLPVYVVDRWDSAQLEKVWMADEDSNRDLPKRVEL